MKSTLIVVAALSIAVVAISHASAQSRRQEMNACLADLIQRRVQSQQPVQLSAQTITLTGDTLRLAGRALIRFNDTSIRADEALFNQVTKRIDLVGNASAFLGSASDCVATPQIEFR